MCECECACVRAYVCVKMFQCCKISADVLKSKDADNCLRALVISMSKG